MFLILNGHFTVCFGQNWAPGGPQRVIVPLFWPKKTVFYGVFWKWSNVNVHFTVCLGHFWAQRGQNTVCFEAHMSKTSSFTVICGPSGPFWAILGSKRAFLGVKLANFGPKRTVKYGVFWKWGQFYSVFWPKQGILHCVFGLKIRKHRKLQLKMAKMGPQGPKWGILHCVFECTCRKHRKLQAFGPPRGPKRAKWAKIGPKNTVKKWQFLKMRLKIQCKLALQGQNTV